MTKIGKKTAYNYLPVADDCSDYQGQRCHGFLAARPLFGMLIGEVDMECWSYQDIGAAESCDFGSDNSKLLWIAPCPCLPGSLLHLWSLKATSACQGRGSCTGL